MSAAIKLDNYTSSNIVEKSYLDEDYASGTVIVVKSAQNFDVDRYVLLGTEGQETTELRRITDVTGTNVTVDAAFDYPHDKYENVTVLNSNQLKLYRATYVAGSTPGDSDFSQVGVAIDIDTDELQTTATDPTGSSSYWYRYTFYNQETTEETALAQSASMRGGAIYVYATIDQIREEAGIENNPYISDSYVEEQRIEAQSVIDSVLSGYYTVPFTTPSAIIERCTKLLAAGYILQNQDTGGDTFDKGQKKIDQVLGTKDMPGLLSGIISGTSPLVDENGDQIISGNRPNGWPDRTTATTPGRLGGGRRKFRMTDKY